MNRIKEKQNIPQGWKRVSLGDLVSITTGSRDANHGSPDGQYPFYTCAQKISKIDNFSFDTEAVLIAGNGDFNVKYYKGKFDAYQRTYVLSDFQNTTGHFVYQKAKEALNDIMRNNQGSSVKFIKMGDLANYEFTLPPIKEQQKIAEILGTVDENIEKTQEMIEATEKLKRGLMQQFFTRGIGHAKFEKVKLEDVSKISTGTTPSTSKQDYYGGENPFIKTGEIINEKITGTNMFISDQAVKDYRLKKYQPGTILVAMYGQGKTRGQTAFLEIEACITQNAAAIEPTEDIDSVYLWFFLKSQYELLRGGGVQGHISHLNLSYMKSYEVPVPPLREQQEIAEILSAVDEKTSVNKKLKTKLTLLKKGLMQDLLSGKVRTI